MADRLENKSIDLMMTEILQSLEIIRGQLPNGELKAIQLKIESIDKSQAEMQSELKSIKKQLLDPESGLVVRVNKNTESRLNKEKEDLEHELLMREHLELMSFKKTVTKIVWIVFTAIAGIIAALLFGQFGGPQ